MQRDPYVVLGVPRSESAAGVRSAFRDLARRFHPDRTGPGGVAMFREILEAYAILSDSSARAQFDRSVAVARRARRVPGPAGDVRSLRDGDDVRPGVEPLFARIASNFSGRGVKKGEHVEELVVDVRLTEEEASRGAVVTLGMPVLRRCPACAGLGGTFLMRCARCHGEGLVEAARPVPIHIPPGISDRTEILVPLARAGIHNLVVAARVVIERRA